LGGEEGGFFRLIPLFNKKRRKRKGKKGGRKTELRQLQPQWRLTKNTNPFGATQEGDRGSFRPYLPAYNRFQTQKAEGKIPRKKKEKRKGPSMFASPLLSSVVEKVTPAGGEEKTLIGRGGEKRKKGDRATLSNGLAHFCEPERPFPTKGKRGRGGKKLPRKGGGGERKEKNIVRCPSARRVVFRLSPLKVFLGGRGGGKKKKKNTSTKKKKRGKEKRGRKERHHEQYDQTEYIMPAKNKQYKQSVSAKKKEKKVTGGGGEGEEEERGNDRPDEDRFLFLIPTILRPPLKI